MIVKSCDGDLYLDGATREECAGISHPGQCSRDVEVWLSCNPQAFDEVSSDCVRQWLKQTGAWNTSELIDDDDNKARAIWILAGDYLDNRKDADED